MEQKDDLKAKITNLLDGLANLTEADLLEAREILKNAGKNPDKIVAKAMKQLKAIRQRSSQNRKGSSSHVKDKQLAFPVIVSDFSSEPKLRLGYTVKENETILSAGEVYAFFILKKYSGGVFNAGDLSDISEAVSFRKIIQDIFTEFDFSNKRPIVRFRFRKMDGEIISIQDIAVIIQTGYIISDLVWYPINQNSLDTIRDIHKHLADDGSLDIKVALDYYFNRKKYPTIVFTPAELTSEIIMSHSGGSAPGNLFVRDLYTYQKEGLKWLQHCCVTRTGGILGDDMGLGKTAQAISMITWALQNNVFEKFLIVVPGTLIENWRREFKFFAPSIEPYIHHGGSRTGSVMFINSKQIVITSYSMIINDLYLFNKVNWGVIIADEASLLKNPDSERRNSLKAVPADVKIVMTGTPVENSLMDLWSLADLTNAGFLGSRSEFSARYIKHDIETTISESDLQQLRKDTSLIMLRRKKEDVLELLPERIDIHQALTMKTSEAELYDRQRESILSQEDRGAVMLGLIQELRKYTTHPMLSTGNILDSDLKELSSTSAKLERTIQLLDEIKENREKVLIFTEYLEMIDAFSRVIEKEYNVPVFTIDGRIPMEQRQVNIDLFTAAKGFTVMVLNPRTAGMGLNITAANHVIHYTRQWNPALEEQATARAHRNKQTKDVNVYYLYYANTIEEVIDQRLRAKSRLSREVISSIPEDMSMVEYLNALKLSPTRN